MFAGKYAGALSQIISNMLHHIGAM
jgi:hypothetical protein